MNKEQLWAEIIRQNPEFTSRGAAFAPAGLRKFFDLVWENGYKEGLTDGRGGNETGVVDFIHAVLGVKA